MSSPNRRHPRREQSRVSPSGKWGPKASQSGSLRFSLGSGAVGVGVVGWAAHPWPLVSIPFWESLFLSLCSVHLLAFRSSASVCFFYPLPYMDHYLNLCCNPAPWAVVPAPGKFPQEPSPGAGPDQTSGRYPCPQARSHWAEHSEMREG